MDKETMADIMKSVQDQPSSKGLNQASPRTPPRNPIIAKKKAEEWDETFTRLEQKLDGMIVDGDAQNVLLKATAENLMMLNAKVEGVAATKLLLSEQVRSLSRQILWRDVIIILLLALIAVAVGFNTMQFWGWE